MSDQRDVVTFERERAREFDRDGRLARTPEDSAADADAPRAFGEHHGAGDTCGGNRSPRARERAAGQGRLDPTLEASRDAGAEGVHGARPERSARRAEPRRGSFIVDGARGIA